jgi:ATP-dependent Clp protease ATP-binding subunit ClpC
MNDFTPRAQQVFALARKEAERFHHNYVGTEHLLLGLIKLGQGVAVAVLQKMGLDLETVRMEVEKHVGSHPETNIGNIPYTPRVKKVLALAGKRGQSVKSFLRRYRTHFAGTLAGRRGSGRTGIKESGS